MSIFKLPDLGEGLPDAEIVQWYVAIGDMVEIDTPLVSMETAKAVVEVPSPYRGKIIKLHGQKGEVIKTGNPLIEFELIEQRPDTGTVAGSIEVGNTVIKEEAIAINGKAGTLVKATPAVRALAQRLKIDLSQVMPTGPEGTITAQDVKTAQERMSTAGDLEPLKGVRRAMAQAMEQSHAQVVPVTLYEDADISHWPSESDITVRLLEAIVVACNKEPALNAWYEGHTMGRRLLRSVHIGLAVDTPEGLFVPVIHEAQTFSTKELREQIDLLREAVQTRKIAKEKLQGASFILSNFGKFSGKYATPIVLPPMVAILGVGRKYETVLPIQNQIQIRKLLPLSLSFDHRAVTGGEATRFMGILQAQLQG